MIDSTHARAHRLAAGAKGEFEQAAGRSRGGRTTKIHCLADSYGRPVAFSLTPGNIADISIAIPLLRHAYLSYVRPKRLLADKAYDANALRKGLKLRRIKAIIPSTATPTKPFALDRKYTAAEPHRTLLRAPEKLAQDLDQIRPPGARLPLRNRTQFCSHCVDPNESST
jgi:transposase|tara:strand:- start:92243 stop:92749 length:507 start_codon:yes stop_codon:yes gene_type:complete